MTNRTILSWLWLGATLFAAVGCASSQSRGVAVSATFGPEKVTPETMATMVITFGDDHVTRVFEAIDPVIRDTDDLEERAGLNQIKLQNAQATFEIAGGTNPISGMIDMVVLASLSRESIRRLVIDRRLTDDEKDDPRSFDVDEDEVIGLMRREDRRLYRAFTRSEQEIRRLAARAFYPEEIEQLDGLIDNWWQENPQRRFVSNVRLQDFARARGASVETVATGPRNLLGLIALDPFASMDPATREIAQSRMLAERVTYQVNRLPITLSLHARSLLYETLTTDEVVSMQRALMETEESIETVANRIDRWPEDVAREREAAIEQVLAEVSVEREAAIEQLVDAIGTEREALITDVERAVARQREALFESIETRTGTLQETMTKLNTTLETATGLSGSVNDTVRSIDGMDVENFQQLVRTTTEGVTGLERSLETIERILTSDRVAASVDGFEAGAGSAASVTEGVIDHLFVRGLQLAAIVLVGWVVAALLLRVLSAKLVGRPTA